MPTEQHNDVNRHTEINGQLASSTWLKRLWGRKRSASGASDTNGRVSAPEISASRKLSPFEKAMAEDSTIRASKKLHLGRFTIFFVFTWNYFEDQYIGEGEHAGTLITKRSLLEFTQVTRGQTTSLRLIAWKFMLTIG